MDYSHILAHFEIPQRHRRDFRQFLQTGESRSPSFLKKLDSNPRYQEAMRQAFAMRFAVLAAALRALS